MGNPVKLLLLTGARAVLVGQLVFQAMSFTVSMNLDGFLWICCAYTLKVLRRTLPIFSISFDCSSLLKKVLFFFKTQIL